MTDKIKQADDLMGERAMATGYARMDGADEAEINRLSNLYKEAKAEYERLCREAGVALYATYNA